MYALNLSTTVIVIVYYLRKNVKKFKNLYLKYIFLIFLINQKKLDSMCMEVTKEKRIFEFNVNNSIQHVLQKNKNNNKNTKLVINY